MSPGVAAPLDLAELARLLQAADPATLLVPPRLLRRVIKHNRRMAGLGLQVPHRKCYFLARDALLGVVERAELEIEADRELPEHLILIARPDADKVAAMPRGRALVKYWRLLFHARVHLAVEHRLASGRLTEAGVRARVDRLGQTEFDEIRSVLRQENFLLPPYTDAVAYAEFAAVYLEMRHFAATLLPRYFPALKEDAARVEAVLAEDVDAPALYEATRLADAPDPTFPADSSETAEPVPTLVERLAAPLTLRQAGSLLARAEKARAVGNVVRAALCATRAAGAAEGDRATEARAAARADLQQLLRRLQVALHLEAAEAGEWGRLLALLLDDAARGHWPAEARLLYDLQKVCIDHERAIYSPDVVEWLYSHFRQPLVRPLPNQPLVLVVKHLRRALHRSASVRLGGPDRARLSTFLRSALHHAESRLRDRFRPLLHEALAGVGLRPRTFVERVAQHKLVEELLDRVAERGLLTMGDLRDAISRNDLKLPDLSGPVEFFLGDPLIRVNRRLAESLYGVYRRGEFYLRWLQRLSSVAFGTRPGRFLTRFSLLPFGAAFVALEGTQHVVDMVAHTGVHFTNRYTVLLLGCFFLGLLYLPAFRAGVVRGLRGGWRLLRGLLVDLPAAVLRLPLVRRVLDSRPVTLAARYGLKPALFALPAWYGLDRAGVGPAGEALGTGGVLVAAALLINSRLGRNLEEAAVDWLVRHWHQLHTNVLPGLFRWVLDAFKLMLETLDRALYTVDEWLRFRSGEGRLSLVFKTVFGLLWFLVTYVIRFCVNLLIEPQINPIKHFPVVTVSHKLVMGLGVPFVSPLVSSALNIPLRRAAALTGAVGTAIPGIFGFLAWELRENWRLYAANRPRFLRPVLIGHHGETMRRLLQLGLHSGTVPRLWARLRRAERRAHRTGVWSGPRKYRDALRHVAEAVGHFIERELLPLLNDSHTWDAGPVAVGTIEMATNRIRVALDCPGLSPEPLHLAFEEQSGWLLAGVRRAGWLRLLTPEQRATLRDALAGLYQKAGVQLVREQLASCLGADCPAYDLRADGLAVWPGQDYETEVLYDLGERPWASPRVCVGQAAAAAPVLCADRLLFAERGIAWVAWSEAWERDQAGKGHELPLLPDLRLLPPEACKQAPAGSCS
jgi:hypothetical protein